MNLIDKLQSKYASDIKRYGITEVTIVNGKVDVKSTDPIPYDLYYSFEIYLL